MRIGRIVISISIALMMLGSTVMAYSISVRPSSITAEDLLRGGYHEEELIITAASENYTNVRFSLDGTQISDWVHLHPTGTVKVRKGEPAEVVMTIEPPADTPNGEYEGTLRFSFAPEKTDSDGNTVFSVHPGFAVPVTAEVIGQEIYDCKVYDIRIPTREGGTACAIEIEAYNRGNVRATPTVTYTIRDGDDDEAAQGSATGDTLMPTERSTITIPIDASLEPGQYFADVQVRDCGKNRKTVMFDILEKGALGHKLEVMHVKPQKVWNTLGDEVKFSIKVRNTGREPISDAHFKGIIEKKGSYIEEVKTQEVGLETGETHEFTYSFLPKLSGRYMLTGHVFYEGKRTFESGTPINVKGTVEEAEETPKQSGGWGAYTIPVMVGIIILLGALNLVMNRK